MTSASTPASVIAALARITSDEAATALEAADLSPEVLAIIEAASVAAAESANKRRLMALDVKNDALGRMGTIQTMIELLLGRHAGSLVCRRWRDASRGLALTKREEHDLVRAVGWDHTNLHLVANLRYYDVTTLDFSYNGDGHEVTDEGVVVLSHLCRNVTAVNLSSAACITPMCVTALTTTCHKITDITISESDASDNIDDSTLAALATLPNLTKIELEQCLHLTDAAITAVADKCPNLAELDVSFCFNLTDAAITAALAKGWPHLTSIDLSFTNVTRLTIAALVKGCPELKRIQLYGCGNFRPCITDLRNSHRGILINE